MVLTRIEGSSQISGIGYDAATRTLRVVFTTGAHYNYANVPAEKVEAFLSAKSKGSHFIKTFKSGKDHPYTKVDGKDAVWG